MMFSTLTAYLAAQFTTWAYYALAIPMVDEPEPDIKFGNGDVDPKVDQTLGNVEATGLRVAGTAFGLLGLWLLWKKAQNKKEQGGSLVLAIIGIVFAIAPEQSLGAVVSIGRSFIPD